MSSDDVKDAQVVVRSIRERVKELHNKANIAMAFIGVVMAVGFIMKRNGRYISLFSAGRQ